MDRFSDEMVERFWALVDRSGGEDICWPWKGPVRADGYGTFNVGVRRELAHRLALELSGVQISADSIAMQVCANRLCCHPHRAHVRIGTRAELMTRRSRLRRVPRPEEKPGDG